MGQPDGSGRRGVSCAGAHGRAVGREPGAGGQAAGRVSAPGGRSGARVRVERELPPGQVVRPDWPAQHYGPVPRFRPETWNFTVMGATESGLSIDGTGPGSPGCRVAPSPPTCTA